MLRYKSTYVDILHMALRDHLHDALLYVFTAVFALTVWMGARTARPGMAGLHQ
jgi:hypothetical protein